MIVLVLSLLACRSHTATKTPVSTDSVWDAHHVQVFGAEQGPICTVLALHGRGDSAENFARVFEDYPGSAQFVFAQAPFDPTTQRPSWFAGTREVDPSILSEQVGTMADRLALGLPAGLPREVKGKPVVTGFSQGGILSFAIATRHPDAVRAAIPVGGMLPPPMFPTAAGATPITVLHGTADRVIPFSKTKATHDSLVAAGWPSELVPFEGIQHRIPQRMRERLYASIQERCTH